MVKCVFLRFLFWFMCICSYISLYASHVCWYLWRPKEGIASSGAEIASIVSCHVERVGHWTQVFWLRWLSYLKPPDYQTFLKWLYHFCLCGILFVLDIFLWFLVWFLTVKRSISFLLQWLAMSVFAHAQLLLCLVVLYIECLHSSPYVKGGVLKYSCLGRRFVILDRYAVSACFLTLEIVPCAQRTWHPLWGWSIGTKLGVENTVTASALEALHKPCALWLEPSQSCWVGNIFYIVTFLVLNLTHVRNFEVQGRMSGIFLRKGARIGGSFPRASVQ